MLITGIYNHQSMGISTNKMDILQKDRYLAGEF